MLTSVCPVTVWNVRRLLVAIWVLWWVARARHYYAPPVLDRDQSAVSSGSSSTESLPLSGAGRRGSRTPTPPSPRPRRCRPRWCRRTRSLRGSASRSSASSGTSAAATARRYQPRTLPATCRNHRWVLRQREAGEECRGQLAQSVRWSMVFCDEGLPPARKPGPSGAEFGCARQQEGQVSALERPPGAAPPCGRPLISEPPARPFHSKRWRLDVTAAGPPGLSAL
jgi:hypothetical protein